MEKADLFGQRLDNADGMDDDLHSLLPFGYTGEQRDVESGLTYLRARYYDPTIGRFMSRDSFAGYARSSQSQNRYAYAGNNPASWVDPTGRAQARPSAPPTQGCCAPDPTPPTTVYVPAAPVGKTIPNQVAVDGVIKPMQPPPPQTGPETSKAKSMSAYVSKDGAVVIQNTGAVEKICGGPGCAFVPLPNTIVGNGPVVEGEWLYYHELEHVKQIERMGLNVPWLPSYMWIAVYVGVNAASGFEYNANPFEKQANDAADCKTGKSPC